MGWFRQDGEPGDARGTVYNMVPVGRSDDTKQQDPVVFVWGDGPAYAIDEALDAIETAYKKDWNRLPHKEEVAAGVMQAIWDCDWPASGPDPSFKPFGEMGQTVARLRFLARLESSQEVPRAPEGATDDEIAAHVERVINDISVALDMDPAEVRKRFDRTPDQ